MSAILKRFIAFTSQYSKNASHAHDLAVMCIDEAEAVAEKIVEDKLSLMRLLGAEDFDDLNGVKFKILGYGRDSGHVERIYNGEEVYSAYDIRYPSKLKTSFTLPISPDDYCVRLYKRIMGEYPNAFPSSELSSFLKHPQTLMMLESLVKKAIEQSHPQVDDRYGMADYCKAVVANAIEEDYEFKTRTYGYEIRYNITVLDSEITVWAIPGWQMKFDFTYEVSCTGVWRGHSAFDRSYSKE